MRTRIVYIAGYGRSGSTLLELLLNEHDRVTGLGEVGNLFDLLATGKACCSCNRPLADCPQWSPVGHAMHHGLHLTLAGMAAIQESMESSLPYRLKSGTRPRSGTDSDAYRYLADRMFAHLPAQPGGEERFWVDSSKTSYRFAQRPVALGLHCGYDVRVVHLVRDVRGVMWSYVSRGCNIRLENQQHSRISMAGLRALAGWITANHWADRLRNHLGPEHYLRLRYEDLAAAPAATLRRLTSWLGIGALTGLNRARIPLAAANHLLAGNRIRTARELTIRPDLQWMSGLPAMYRLVALALTSRRLQRYGYPLRVSRNSR